MISPIALAFIVAQANQPFSLKRSSCEFVSRVTVESCVMSRQYGRYVPSSRIKLEPQQLPLNFYKLAAGIDQIAIYAPDPREVVALPKPKLLLAEQIALLILRRSEAASEIANRMVKNGAFHPRWADYRELARHGYARLSDGSKRHSITSLGSYEADLIVRALSAKLGVHVYSERTANFQVEAHCCCGWSSTVQKGIHSSANLHGHFRRHVVTAEGMAGLAKALKPAENSEAT